MHTFTREFFHPPDRVPQVSPAAAQRFFEDGRRFPASAYEEHSLLWRSSSWRVPSPAERSMMLGVPASATAAVDLEGPRRTQVRNSLLGNGFHIPSIMCILSLLVCLCDAKPRLLQPSPDWELRARLHHTVWEPGSQDSWSLFRTCWDLRMLCGTCAHNSHESRFPTVCGMMYLGVCIPAICFCLRRLRLLHGAVASSGMFSRRMLFLQGSAHVFSRAMEASASLRNPLAG